MECEYQKYGCAIKVANADHAQAHIHHHAPAHARLLAQALDTEIEKNKALTLRVVSLEKAAKENQDKYNKLEELESRFRALQSIITFYAVVCYVYLLLLFRPCGIQAWRAVLPSHHRRKNHTCKLCQSIFCSFILFRRTSSKFHYSFSITWSFSCTIQQVWYITFFQSYFSSSIS